MPGTQRIGEWIIDWEVATAYAPTEGSELKYRRYNRSTDTEDELYEYELPEHIRLFIQTGQ